MPSLRTLILALVAALALGSLTACAGKIKSGTQYSDAAKVSEYSTYAWVTEDLVLLRSGTGNENIRNPENEKRLRAAIEAKLEEAGMTRVDRPDAGLIVMFSVGTHTRPEVGGFLYTLKESESTYTQGTLHVDLFDAQTNEHVWHGWAKRALRPGDDPDEVTTQAVAAIFADFPPS